MLLTNINYCKFQNKMPFSDACGEQVHRNLISPPSLWPGRELRKYHCNPAVLSRYVGATHISVLMYLLAGQWIAALRQGMYRNWRYAIFNVQSAWGFAFNLKNKLQIILFTFL